MKYGTIELISKIFRENKDAWDDEVYRIFFFTIDGLTSEYCTQK